MYVQTAGLGGQSREARSREGVCLPPGREGGSKAISVGDIGPGRGDGCHSCQSSPNLNRRGSQKPRRYRHGTPILDLRGLRTICIKYLQTQEMVKGTKFEH